MRERIPNRVRTIRNWATPNIDSLNDLERHSFQKKLKNGCLFLEVERIKLNGA